MKIGIFGGSFDPVHLEHISLVRAAIESLELDKLIVVPAHTPPHKRNKILSSDEDRLALCRIAFQDIPSVQVSDYEICRGGTSYSYLTCRHFSEEYPNAKLFFLVGTDMLRNFPLWRNPEEILSLATLAVCARAEADGWEQQEQRAFFARYGKNFEVIRYNGKDVSSTRARVYAAAGEDITPLVGERVAAYIQEKGLYKIDGAQEALSLEKPSRRAHSVRVALLAAERAKSLNIDEKKALTAALFHDCAKNLPPCSPLLNGFVAPEGVPSPVLHQYAGAYVAENTFGVSDEEVLNSIRFHTSGKENMTELEKLIFLSDMLESGRDFAGIEELRAAFWRGDRLDECLCLSLRYTLQYLQEKGGDIYDLTQKAYDYIQNKMQEKTGNGGN
jgi:nicotinate-nucleotide adenylyltransferase